MTITTITTERLRTIAGWREKYGNGHNVVIPAEEAESIASELLAAREAVPREIPLTSPVAAEYVAGWNACRAELLNNGAPPTPAYPENLPCPVHLLPGLKFGKGVPTRSLLDALVRRAECEAELEAMTPEQKAEHDAAGEWLKSMLPTPAPAVPPGYKLAPNEPTESMVIDGFESDAFLSLVGAVIEKKGWPYGCEEAAECVTGIFKAMIARIPAAPEVSQ